MHTSQHNELESLLDYLKLYVIKDACCNIEKQAAKKQLSYRQFLQELLDLEVQARVERAVQYRLKKARLPFIKTLDQFKWTHPAKIDQQITRNIFRLSFLEENANVIFLGGVGLGKTHLAVSLAHHACLNGQNVLFTTAVDIINALAAAQAANRFARELKKYLTPKMLIVDELGYMPIDKHGADLLFQVISGRYERGSIILTTNRPFKEWPIIFNNDSTITSAILDRLLHHCQVVVIEGKSYRMKDRTDK